MDTDLTIHLYLARIGKPLDLTFRHYGRGFNWVWTRTDRPDGDQWSWAWVADSISEHERVQVRSLISDARGRFIRAVRALHAELGEELHGIDQDPDTINGLAKRLRSHVGALTEIDSWLVGL